MFGDLHIHMILDGVYYRAAIDAQKEHPLDGLVRARLSDYQARGVCLLRDGGDAWGVSLRARELAGEYGIDYRSPAFPIYRRGHYGAFIGRGFDTEDEYRALLDEAGEKRADFIKLMISGLIDFDHFGVLTEPGPEPQDIRRMIELAHAAGFAVMAHANGDRAVMAALQAGVDSIEHGAKLTDEMVKLFKERGAFLCTTISPALPYALFDRSITNATKRSAELTDIDSITGSIEKGKAADLIVTAQNPLKDLKALRNLEMVISGGRLIEHPKIKKRKQVEAELDKFL